MTDTRFGPCEVTGDPTEAASVAYREGRRDAVRAAEAQPACSGALPALTHLALNGPEEVPL